MANKYDLVPQGQQYVSSYVPLPLDLILKSGAAKQQQLDTARTNLSESTDPFAKLNLGASVKYYNTETGQVEDSGDLGLNQAKNKVVDMFQKEREKLSDDFISGRITDNEFKYQTRQHINKAKNAYNTFASQENAIKQVNEANKELAKNPAFAKSPYYATELLDYNTKWLNNYKEGVLEPYNPPSIAPEFDIQKSLLDFKFKDEGGETVNIGDYIAKYGKKGVTPERVKYAAHQVFSSPLSEVHQYANLNTMHELRKYGLDGEETEYPDGTDITMSVPNGVDKNGNPKFKEVKATLYQKLMQEQAEKFISGSVTQHAGIVKTQDVKANPLASEKAKSQKQDKLWGLSSLQGENVENYKLPDQIKDFVDDKTGKLDIEKDVSKFGESPSFLEVDNKTYDLTNESDRQKLSTLGFDVKFKPIGAGFAQESWEVKDSSGKNVKLKSSVEGKKQELLNWVDNQASKLNIQKDSNESENDFANRVLEQNKLRQQNVILNVDISPIAEDINSYTIGKNGNKFTSYYDDIIPVGKKDKIPVKSFLEKYNIDMSTITANSVSFDKNYPGYMMFSAFDEDGDPVEFYAKSRNVNFSNETGMVTSYINDLKNFYADDKTYTPKVYDGHNVVSIKNYKDKNNNPVEVVILDGNPGVARVNPSTDEVEFIPIEDLKNEAVYNFLESPQGSPYIKDKKDKRNISFEE